MCGRVQQIMNGGLCSLSVYQLKFPLRAGQLACDARIVPARGVHRARERLEQRLDDVMRLVAVKQFEVQIAARLVREALKKFARKSEPERTGKILPFFRLGNFLL